MKQSKSAACVLLAGTLWGSMGLFVRKLNAVGLYALDIVQLRIAISLILVGLYLLIFARDNLRVRLRDLWCFAGTGIVSLLLFSWCYFSGMQEASLSVMAVLLYTSPAFIMLLSVLLFRETLTRQKLLALVLTFTGCCLVSGLGSGSAVSMKGLLLGLGSGFFYALYSIFSRYAIERGYGSWTITFYTFLFCLLASAPLAHWGLIAQALSSDTSVPVYALLMGLLTGFLAYIFYTKGLEGMESSRAGILASVEPVVGTIIGTLVFHEPLPVQSVLGIALVLGGIVVLGGKKVSKA
ncbi:MAG: EamA family transporter [Clostridiales bacterium]|nr:EamA family transporter [Clostridiales bacterium]